MVVQAVAVKAGIHAAKKVGSKVVRKASTRTAGRAGARQTQRAGTRTAGSRAAVRTSTGTATRARTRRVGRTNTRRIGRVTTEVQVTGPQPRGNSFKQKLQAHWTKTESNMESVYELQGQKLTEDIKDDIVNGAEEQTVVFPIFILGVALIKDTVCDVAQLTIVGAVITFMASVLVTIILVIWFFGKMQGVIWKRAMVRWFWLRFFGAIIIESLPLISLIPATTILVFMAANREKKFAQMFNEALEAFHGSGLKGVVKR